jgi:hypothetical protein
MLFVKLAILLLPFLALIAISLPPKSGIRLKFKRKERIEIPETCVVTGKNATERHVVQSFSGNPYYIKKKEMTLPFSAAGWTSYQKAYPISLKTFKGGIASISKAPVLGPYFAIFLWIPFVGFICGLISAVEIFFHKRQLVILNGLNIRKDELCGVDIFGVNTIFAKEFLRLNSKMSLEDYVAGCAKKAILRNIILLVVFCLTLLLLLVVFLDSYGIIRVFPK